MSDEPSLVLFGFCRKAVLAGMSASRRAMWNRDFEGGHNARIGVRTTEGWNVEWRVRTMDEVKPEAPSRQISLGLCYASRRRSSIGRADKKPCSRRLIITERRGLMKPDRESWVAEGVLSLRVYRTAQEPGRSPVRHKLGLAHPHTAHALLQLPARQTPVQQTEVNAVHPQV